MITDYWLEREEPHLLGGVRRTYKFPSGYGLFLLNSKMLHDFDFAWEATVINPDGSLDFKTSLTDDVVILDSDEEANAFITKAYLVLGQKEIDGEDFYDLRNKVTKLVCSHKTWPESIPALEAFKHIIESKAHVEELKNEIKRLAARL